MTLTNKHGRQLDDLDILKLRVGVVAMAPRGSYSICSADGRPVCGLVADPPTPVARLTALEWHSKAVA